MCSRRLTGLLLVVALLGACGRKEPPKPPPSRVPAPISDLTIQQRGMEILLRMTYPSTTLGGLPIENLEALEIWSLKRIIPTLIEGSTLTVEEGAGEPGDAEPQAQAEASIAAEPESAPDLSPEPQVPAESEEVPTATAEAEEAVEESPFFRLPAGATEALSDKPTEDLITVSGREFSGLAELEWTLQGPELESAVVGAELLIRVPIEAIPEEEEVLVFGVRAVAGRRLIAPFSNLVKLLPRTPPPPPTTLKVEAQPQGVEISWEGATSEKGFRVYRRVATLRDYGPPLYTARKDLDRYLDTSAVYNQRYIYTVTSLASTNPVAESAIAAEREVDYQDRFPPSSPRNLVALPEPGRVRLLWEPSTSEDAIGYWIYRQDSGGEFEPITAEPVVGSEYLDRDLAVGRVYRYFVVAADGAGNHSEASNEIEARVP